MKQVIKSNGQTEGFNTAKLQNSIIAACLACQENLPDAQKIANQVTMNINQWLTDKNEVTSKDIRYQVGLELNKISPHVGYLYLQHRIM